MHINDHYDWLLCFVEVSLCDHTFVQHWSSYCPFGLWLEGANGTTYFSGFSGSNVVFILCSIFSKIKKFITTLTNYWILKQFTSSWKGKKNLFCIDSYSYAELFNPHGSGIDIKVLETTLKYKWSTSTPLGGILFAYKEELYFS